MSYCRGILYVIRTTGQPEPEYTCTSPLHDMPFSTPHPRAMSNHLYLHLEDAREIEVSVARATERLRREGMLP